VDFGCSSSGNNIKTQIKGKLLTLSNRLRGKVVLIASHRSGKCISSELTQILISEGAIVYVADTKQKIVDTVVAEALKYTGKTVPTQVFDFFQPGMVEGFIKDIEQKEGRIDVLATDFGLLEFMYHLKPFSLQEKAEWESQYRNIFEVTLLWTKAVIPGMMDRKSGRIIHMVSDTGRLGVPKMALYGALKAAVSAFSRSLAHELARYQITVNCVSIGVQQIDELKDSSQEAIVQLDKTLKLVPLRRYSEPTSMAAMIAYLASDLGAYITGQTISVSGGLAMP